MSLKNTSSKRRPYFSDHFSLAIENFYRDVFDAFNKDLFKKHLDKRIFYNIKNSTLNVKGFVEDCGLIYPFEFSLTISKLTLNNVSFKAEYINKHTGEIKSFDRKSDLKNLKPETIASHIRKKFFD